MADIQEWGAFLEELKTVGCKVLESAQETALVSVPDSDGTIGLLAGDSWLHASVVMIEGTEIDATGQRAALGEFALQLHTRLIGCRFGFKDDGSLGIMVDIYPAMQNPEQVVLVLDQLQWVAIAMMPLFESTLKTGSIPGDIEIDAFFGAAWEDADL